MIVKDSWFRETEAKIKELAAELETEKALSKGYYETGLILAKEMGRMKTEISKVKSQNKAFHTKMTDATHEYKELYEKCEKLKEALRYQGTRSVPTNIPPIVCLCGSTRFMDAFFAAGWKFTLEGGIVLSVGVCKHAKDHGGEALGQDVADKLDELHLRKIDLADSVYVLNVDGYIGESTAKEIAYAKSKNKHIEYLQALEQEAE